MKNRNATMRGIDRATAALRDHGKRWALTGLDLARKLGQELPSTSDSKLRAALKTIGAIDTVRTALYPAHGDPVAQYVARNGLVERRSEPFVRMFWDTDLHTKFAVGEFRVSDYLWLYDARGPLGRLVFTKSDYQDKHDARFYVGRDVDMPQVLDGLWGHYEGRLHVAVTPTLYGESRTEFSAFGAPEAPLFGPARAEMERLLARHRRCTAQGAPRSYMLFGPPGTGKSSFALAFASALGERTLKLDAASLGHASVKDMAYLLENLGPEFLLIDDVDKVGVGNAMPTLLEVIQRCTRTGSATVMMTANAIGGFDQGLLRPGRINTWVEFRRPDLQERYEVLRAYAAALGAGASEIDMTYLAQATNGLTHDYLRELVVELRQCGELREVLELAETMKRLLSEVEKSSSPAAKEAERLAKAEASK